MAFVNGGQIDPLDPAIDYISFGWQIEYATCAQLVNYPDAAAPAGHASTRGREVVRRLGRRADLHVQLRERVPVLAALEPAGHGRCLQACTRPRPRSGHGEPGREFFRDVVSVTVVGDRQLEIRLAHPAGDFLSRLAMPFACAVPPGTPSTAQQTPLPSAGPYYISGYTRDSRIVLSRNPNYKGPRPSNLDQILYQLNVTAGPRCRRSSPGTADYAAGGLPVAAYAQVAHDFPTQFFVNPIASLRYIAMNTSRAIFSTAAARQAVNLALDRPALIATSGPSPGARPTSTSRRLSPASATRASIRSTGRARPTSHARTRSSTRPGSRSDCGPVYEQRSGSADPRS